MNFEDIQLPSNKKFGLTFSLIFLIISIYFLYYETFYIFFIFFFLSASTFLVSLIHPNILRVFNRSWMRFGFYLGKIVSPIVMLLIFLVLITPIALITKILGRDELKLKKTNVQSYWSERKQSIDSQNNFEKQF